jgi:hypothetical protein
MSQFRFQRKLDAGDRFFLALVAIMLTFALCRQPVHTPAPAPKIPSFTIQSSR